MRPLLQPIEIPNLECDLECAVRSALAEDVGEGDISAGLVDKEQESTATIICREDCIICGIAWVEEVFTQLGAKVRINWNVKDSDSVSANTELCTLTGKTRDLLTGERTALNFLQLLSGTATISHAYSNCVRDSSLKILDTRKTVPGLRTAQKYAVKCGGCENHRIGLYDAFLIKENHIIACGGVSQAIFKARELASNKIIEIEVESLDQLLEAIDSQADIVMLDNFSHQDLLQAVEMSKGKVKLEVSGNIDKESLDRLKNIGVDFASIGAITKHIRAIDLSMRFA